MTIFSYRILSIKPPGGGGAYFLGSFRGGLIGEGGAYLRGGGAYLFLEKL